MCNQPMRQRLSLQGEPSAQQAREDLRRWRVNLVIPAVHVWLIWLVWLVGVFLGDKFYWLGVYPRTFRGLLGILLMPLLHADVEHALTNSVSLLVLGTLLFHFYPRRGYRVYLLGWLLTGLGVWCFARPSYHVGASGLVYALAFYMFFSGLLHRDRVLVAISLLVVFLYGSLLWGMLAVDPAISWEGHLCGAVVGVLLSLIDRLGESEPPHAYGHGQEGMFDFRAQDHTGPPSWRIRFYVWALGCA